MSGERLNDRLATRRLLLRPLDRADARAIEALCGRDFEVVRWLTSLPWPPETGSAEAFVETALDFDPLEQEAIFAVTLGGVFIGVVAVEAPGDLAEHPDCPTLGYWIGRPFQGFGYACEAAGAALDWAFAAHDCAGVAARVFVDNGPSRRLLERLGFRETGRMTRHARALNRDVTNIVLYRERTRPDPTQVGQ